MNPAWHALLAPLPDDAVARRRPVGSPEILATPHGSAIAGWEQLTVDLSAGAGGLRIILVVLDGDGRPISASDAVLYRIPDETSAAVRLLHESIGGRIEPDGTFRGTYWRAEGTEPAEGEEPQWDMTHSEPTAAHISGLMALVADVVRRQTDRT